MNRSQSPARDVTGQARREPESPCSCNPAPYGIFGAGHHDCDEEPNDTVIRWTLDRAGIDDCDNCGERRLIVWATDGGWNECIVCNEESRERLAARRAAIEELCDRYWGRDSETDDILDEFRAALAGDSHE